MMNLSKQTANFDFRQCEECEEVVEDDLKNIVNEMCSKCRKLAKKYLKTIFNKTNILYTLEKQLKEEKETEKKGLFCRQWSGSGSGHLPTFFYGTRKRVLYTMLEDELDDCFEDRDLYECVGECVASTTNVAQAFDKIILDWEECLEQVDVVVC